MPRCMANDVLWLHEILNNYPCPYLTKHSFSLFLMLEFLPKTIPKRMVYYFSLNEVKQIYQRVGYVN